jgi:hypothetical protein
MSDPRELTDVGHMLASHPWVTARARGPLMSQLLTRDLSKVPVHSSQDVPLAPAALP